MKNREGEFGFIERLMAPLSSGPGTFGLSNDGCVIKPKVGHELVITTDTLIEGVHYMNDTSPELVAAKLVGVNLSDLAAMGARPVGYTLNCSFKQSHDFEWFQQFVDELRNQQEKIGFSLLGGDTTKTSGPGVFSLTAFGEIKSGKSLVRNLAEPDDLIFVTGTIGDAALGLKVAQGEINDPTGFLLDRYQRPQPRHLLGQKLPEICSTCLDISDGLYADLSHICTQSGIGAQIQIDKIPLSSATKDLLIEDSLLLSNIISGGDDYELLFAVKPKHVNRLQEIAEETGTPVTQIGTFTREISIQFMNADGEEFKLNYQGYRHF